MICGARSRTSGMALQAQPAGSLPRCSELVGRLRLDENLGRFQPDACMGALSEVEAAITAAASS